jgi:hypothetical protein
MPYDETELPKVTVNGLTLKIENSNPPVDASFDPN